MPNFLPPALLSSVLSLQQEIALCPPDLSRLLNMVPAKIEALTQADGVVIELVDGEEMVYHGVSGLASPYLGLRLHREKSLSGLAIKRGEILRCRDAETDMRVDRAACRNIGLRSMLIAPLSYQGQNHGVLKLLSKEPDAFDDDAFQLLQFISVLVGAKVWHALDFQAKITLLARSEKQQAFLEAVLENIHDGIVACDAEGRLTLFNHASREFHGPIDVSVPPEQWAQHYDLHHPDGRFMSAEEIPLYKALHDGQIDNQLMLILSRQHNPHLVSVSGQALHDKQGACLGAVVSMHDITEIKNVENALRNANQALLDQSEELRRVNEELESFSYSVSHDLKAPLRSISGFSQILMEDHASQLNAEGQALFRRIRASSQHMAQLIDALLDLAHITRSEMHWEKVDLSHMVRATLDDLCAQESGRQVELHIAENLCAQGDRNLLQVALTNLLQNAWKFTRGRATACIEFDARLSDEGKRVYYVRDNGAGFDAAYGHKLFIAFQRLHGANEYEGTGIGLATVQRIIHRHGGRVWAEGAVDHGATFYFTLP